MFFVRFWLPFFLLFVFLRGGAWCSTYTLIWTKWTSRNLAILCFPHYETVGDCREVDEQKLAIHMCFRYYENSIFGEFDSSQPLGQVSEQKFGSCSWCIVSEITTALFVGRVRQECPHRNLATAADLFPRLRKPYFWACSTDQPLGDKCPSRNLATAADLCPKLRKPHFSAKCRQQIFGKTKNHVFFLV